MDSNPRQLAATLRETLFEINSVIDALILDSENVSIYRMTDRNGKPVLADMLLAKSNCLLALSNLQNSTN